MSRAAKKCMYIKRIKNWTNQSIKSLVFAKKIWGPTVAHGAKGPYKMNVKSNLNLYSKLL